MKNFDLILNKVKALETKTFINVSANNFTDDEWKSVIKLLNGNYRIQFKQYQTDLILNYIDYDLLQSFWNKQIDTGFMAIVYVENCEMNCFFNSREILDFDFLYNDSVNEKNLRSILVCINELSKTTSKVFYLEEDSYQNDNAFLKISSNKSTLI